MNRPESRNPDSRVVTADDVDAGALDAFLRRFFSPAHCDFLNQHGAWWHRGQQHRHVAVVGDDIAGYCSVIPSPCRLAGETRPAHWWVDLVVDPRFRGRGLQTEMDERVRHGTEVLLGFPNALAARIHRKHGWGVSEEHLILLMPFQPSRLRPVLRATGARGLALRAVARLAWPLAYRLRQRALRYQPVSARRLKTPNAGELADIFERYHDDTVTTTCRHGEHLHWRYFEAPYSDQLDVFVAGARSPQIAAITRSRPTDHGPRVKILDLFGELDDPVLIADLLRRVAQEAARRNAVELSAFATQPHLFSIFRSAGFVLRTLARSCWHSADPTLMRLLDQHPSHWTYADSDQEDPA